MFFKKVFLKIFRHSQKNTCVGVSFSGLNVRNLIKKRLQHRCFPMNIAKFLKTALFYRTHPVATSGSKNGTFWHVVSTGHFYVSFVWAMAVSDFPPLEIHKNFSLPLSTITFTINSHADNHFYKYIYLFQILYSIIQFTVLNVKTLIIPPSIGSGHPDKYSYEIGRTFSNPLTVYFYLP